MSPPTNYFLMESCVVLIVVLPCPTDSPPLIIIRINIHLAIRRPPSDLVFLLLSKRVRLKPHGTPSGLSHAGCFRKVGLPFIWAWNFLEFLSIYTPQNFSNIQAHSKLFSFELLNLIMQIIYFGVDVLNNN